MKVKLTRDTIVRFPADTILEVADEEGKRLMAFGNATEVKPEKKTKKGASK